MKLLSWNFISFPFVWVVGLLFLSGCSGPLFDGRQTQGSIKYKLSFPYNEGDLLVELFPQEMTMEFSDSRTRSTLKSLGDVVRTEVITDNKDKKFYQFLKSYENKYLLELDANGVNSMVSAMPQFRIVNTNEKDSVAGYLCSKSIAYFLTDSVPPITLYYTNDISIENPNWWTQFNSVPGVLLAYEVEQYGMRMKLEATEVSFREVEDERFDAIPQGTTIDLGHMQTEMKKLVAQFDTPEQ